MITYDKMHYGTVHIDRNDIKKVHMAIIHGTTIEPALDFQQNLEYVKGIPCYTYSVELEDDFMQDYDPPDNSDEMQSLMDWDVNIVISQYPDYPVFITNFSNEKPISADLTKKVRWDRAWYERFVAEFGPNFYIGDVGLSEGQNFNRYYEMGGFYCKTREDRKVFWQNWNMEFGMESLEPNSTQEQDK